MTFDKGLIEDIIRENFLPNLPDIIFNNKEGISLRDDTPMNMKSINIKLNNFNKEVQINMTQFFCDDLIIQKRWNVVCLNYDDFNFALEYLLNK